MNVTLQFHPDWPFGDGLVIEAMARAGGYRSQFETGTSNGGLTAVRGGDRWRWENRLFAGRYDDGPAADRPVYGALDHDGRAHGAAVRFGSAYARLRPEATERSTFCFPDSVFEPDVFGGPERIDELVALCRAAAHDDLDDYVEAQVHGGVRFDTDVEAVVLDPCFRDGPVHAAADRLGCPVEWHPGFRVATAGLDPAYRGPEFVALARSLGDELVPSTIGDAARTGHHDPQSLKRVWHLLARFGRQPTTSDLVLLHGGVEDHVVLGVGGAGAAEGLELGTRRPALVDVDPRGVEQVGGDGEVEAARSGAGQADDLLAVAQVLRAEGGIDDQVSGNDDHAGADCDAHPDSSQ